MDLSSIYNQVKKLLEEIRDERRTSANTASRVGNALLALFSLITENTNFLRKDQDDRTEHSLGIGKDLDVDGNATIGGGLGVDGDVVAAKGVQFGKTFNPDMMVGYGGKVDEKGNAVLESAVIRRSLTVPKIDFNEVNVIAGIQWRTAGLGAVKEVAIDTDAAGNALQSGTITLDLKEGEIGRVAVDDLCMGVFHNLNGGNDTADYDDRHGAFRFAGFSTVYFRITEILDTATKESFKYVLRGVDEKWTSTHHPMAAMKFAAYTNVTDESRQSGEYSTLEYTLSYTGVDTWEITPHNYVKIDGKLDGFSMPSLDGNGQEYLKEFSGYGQVFGNAYMYGRLDMFDRIAYKCVIDQSLGGSLAPGETQDITVTVLDGYGNDVTAQFTHISVTRSSGDNASDALWNAEHTSVTNPFPIGFSDLGIDGITRNSTLFTVTCSDEVDKTVQANITFI